MNQKIGDISNYAAAFILLILGSVYLFKNSFMPYHSQAVSMKWIEVESSMQVLILALMRPVAGGYLAAAVVIFVLQKKFSSGKVEWIPGLILATGLIVSFSSIYATLIVRLNSPGKPPTSLAIFGIVLLLIGYVFNRKAIEKNLKS